jgi:hypothetical protein
MKLWITYIAIFSLGLTSFVYVVKNAPSPETVILGEWQELAWEYEKVNKTTNDSDRYKIISDDVKHLIGQNLIIHEAESWVFLPNGRLRLTTKNGTKTVKWRIKGRGHVLVLKYDENISEIYNISELDEDKLVLNFEADIQARGIAKLTFNKQKK